MAAGPVCSLLAGVTVLALATAPAWASVPALPAVAVADAGRLMVSVRVRAEQSETARAQWVGLLSLSVPLERTVLPSLAEPSGDSVQAPELPGSGANGTGSESPAGDLPGPRAGRAAAPTPSGLPPDSRPRRGGHAPPAAIELDAELARATVRAALRAAGFPAGTQRLASLSTRARTSAALPELRVRGGRATDESLRLSPTSDDPYRYTQAGGYRLFAELQLTWKLNRLVFSTAELRLETLRRQRAQS
jgi:hypothetical protein